MSHPKRTLIIFCGRSFDSAIQWRIQVEKGVTVRTGTLAGSQGEAEISIKAPNPVDKYVGSRVRMRRIMLGISQEKLGKSLGLTFQQIQKYEKGTNRVGASRIPQISEILQVPVSFLFEGGRRALRRPMVSPKARRLPTTPTFPATSEGLALTRAFTRITDAKLRRGIVDLVEQITGREASETLTTDIPLTCPRRRAHERSAHLSLACQ
jgi:transcriptional regulator with XRE-family HTH domain